MGLISDSVLAIGLVFPGPGPLGKHGHQEFTLPSPESESESGQVSGLAVPTECTEVTWC